jgi:hypothetical protein
MLKVLRLKIYYINLPVLLIRHAVDCAGVIKVCIYYRSVNKDVKKIYIHLFIVAPTESADK